MKKYMKRALSFIICLCMILGALSMVSCNTDKEESEDITDAADKIDAQVENSKWITAPRVIANVKKGTVITGDHIMMSVVEKDGLPKGTVTDVEEIIGKYAATDLSVGAYVYERNLSSAKVEADPVVKEPTHEELKAELKAELEAQIREEIAAEAAKDAVKAVKLMANVKKGDVIGENDVAVVTVKSSEMPEGAFDRVELVVGKYAKTDLLAGAFVFNDELSLLKVDADEAIDPETLEQIKNEVKLSLEEKLKEELSDELTADLSAELKAEIEAELRAELEGEYKDTLSVEIREQLEEQLRAELEAEIKNEIENSVDSAADLGYVIITDYVAANSGKDVSSAIQKVIDENPNRTIYFPDGEYLLSKPIATSGNPVNSVSLHLSNYAVLKASSSWSSSEALVRMGGAEPYNNISTNGSNYYFYGGILDGNGIANGISIDSGRETSIRNVSIKHTFIGLHIKTGANNRSSDADIDTVNIVGNNQAGSIGAYIVGYDNTLTNMRIASVQTGVKLEGGGNFLRNIHPLMIAGGYSYSTSIGFNDLSGGNWYDFCYSDQFAVGFQMTGGTLSTYQTCFCFWYKKDSMQVGFKSTGKFNSTIWNSKVNLSHTDITSAYLIANAGGGGRIECAIFNKDKDTVGDYLSYIKDEPMWSIN